MVSAITKPLAYIVNPTTTLVKSLRYKVSSPVTIRKRLTYVIIRNITTTMETILTTNGEEIILKLNVEGTSLQSVNNSSILK